MKSLWFGISTESRSNRYHLDIIWRENEVSIEISKRWHWCQVNEISKHKKCHKQLIKVLNIPSVLSIPMKRPLNADSLEQRMLEKICQDLKWSQLNCNVPRLKYSTRWTLFKILFAVNIADVDWINLFWLMYTFIYKTEISNKMWPN